MQAGSLRITAFMLVLVVLSLLPSNIVAAQDTRWWERHDEGWFFYDDPQKSEERDEAPPERRAEPENQPLALEAMKKQGERLLSEAMVDPTEKNVKKYMQFHKETMDMSQDFAYVWQRMLQKYPDLSVETGTAKVNDDIKKTVTSLGSKAGLFFIYSAGCDSCQKSVSIIAEFRGKYPNFSVLPITIDSPLPGLEDSKIDNGISVRLGVEAVPAFYLAYPEENRFERIGTGLLPLSEIERRLYHYAITEDMGIPASDYAGN